MRHTAKTIERTDPNEEFVTKADMGIGGSDDIDTVNP
jgi:hypothetical protein